MKTTMFAAVLALSMAAPSAVAHDYKAGPIEIAHPWSRATPKGASVAGGYLKLTNTGETPDRLVAGSSEISGRFEIHEMSMDKGVMRMRPLRNGLEIKPGQTVELKPGSFHVMFLDLKKPLQQGERIKGTLVFEKAGTVAVEFAVEAIGASPGQPGRAHQH